ncbi:MAG: hypothetical protein CSA18_05160 [Deltaproteobacteria bacterium]|nr:MAG: hypothetical protein CSA18_05160 [Deltaproteobacteria bacterium]
MIPAENDTKVTFIYDFLGRRVQKTTYAYRAGTWAEQSTKKFVYDGWHLIAELDEAGEVTRYFVWEFDLSQTLQGAGGVGGLICAVDSTSGSSQTYQYCYDGNGNVGQVVNGAGGAIVASYAYDPFGKTIKADGVYPTENTFKFSTKFFDIEYGLYCFGYRYYSPQTGRWVRKDPINEIGLKLIKNNNFYFKQLNSNFEVREKKQSNSIHYNSELSLYSYVQSNPINAIDPEGLCDFQPSDSSACEYYKDRCENERRICVGQAHYDCYMRCNGAHRAAWRLFNLPPECQDAMDWVGGMGLQILY